MVTINQKILEITYYQPKNSLKVYIINTRSSANAHETIEQSTRIHSCH